MNNDKIICPRCSMEMKKNSRYCMKCGYLNYNHPENITMKPYMKKLQDTTHYVNGKAEVRQYIGVNRNHELRFGSNTGNKKMCFFVNIVLYILFLVFVYILYSSKYKYYMDIIYSSMPFIYILISLLFMYLYAVELIYMKFNHRWWTAFIPIYNIFILSYKVVGSYWYGLLSLIPIINVIYFCVLIYKLGCKFKYNGFLFFIFWPIFIPICGFGTRPFDNITYVSGLESDSLEKEYKLKNSFVIVVTSILIGCFCLIFCVNRALLLNPIKTLNKYYYVYASRAIVNSVKTDIRIRTIYCDDGVYINSNDGEFYFYYDNASEKVSLLLNNVRDKIESYVKVVNKDGSIKYYVSLTDGTYGIKEKEVTDISLDDVVKMKKISEIYKNGNNCGIKTDN